MSDYKKLIQEKIKDEIDKRIQKLRNRLLNLSGDWEIIFPKGFRPGLNILPIVTQNGKTMHLVAELHLDLADDLDLDVNDINIIAKDQPWQQSKEADLGDSLDILNNIVISLNEFIQKMNFKVPNTQMQLFPNVLPGKSSSMVIDSGTKRLEKEISDSLYLPGWFKDIRDESVKQQLLTKLADAYQQYEQSSDGPVTLKSFFEKYTEHLKSQGLLHHYCSYKGKPVELSSDGKCTEQYCTKKPYHSRCTIPVLRFGKEA